MSAEEFVYKYLLDFWNMDIVNKARKYLKYEHHENLDKHILYYLKWMASCTQKDLQPIINKF